jgi:mannose-6-phosphate isomerase-like protein (cupin superfamily)
LRAAERREHRDRRSHALPVWAGKEARSEIRNQAGRHRTGCDCAGRLRGARAGQGSRGGPAVFSLPPQAVSKAVAHYTVEEIWYVISGSGRMWRKLTAYEEIVLLGPGGSLTIPTGTHFQFRCEGPDPIVDIGATMPPWPGEGEAYGVRGVWQATVQSLAKPPVERPQR